MPETKITVAGFLGMETDRERNTLAIRFCNPENDVYVLTIGAGYLGGFIVGLLSQAANLAGAGSNQPMTLYSTRPFTLADGRVGLMMALENGAIQLPVLFPREAIQHLRSLMDMLENHSTGEPGKPSRH